MDLLIALFAWMPIPVAAVCMGLLFILVLVAVLKVIAFIKDLIPFL